MKKTGKSTALAVAILETEEDLKKDTKNSTKILFKEKPTKKQIS
jgi:hypothetical protein